MDGGSERELALLAKIRDLSQERAAEVEDFIDFLRTRDEHRELVQAAAQASEPSLAAAWDDPEDDAYNGVRSQQSETVGSSSVAAKRSEPSENRAPTADERPITPEHAHSQPRSSSPHEGEAVYQRYVKPVEHLHPDEYVLVTPDGGTIFAPSMDELAEKTAHIHGWDNWMFKVGDIAVGHIR
jgi:hypothetical protein